ncbi:MAG: RNA polymerase sigma factor [Actinomycetes bacterium]
MEAASITNSRAGAISRDGIASPLLRLQSDDRLVTLTRRGNEGAFELLVSRYQSKLLNFCRHMLNNREDAEDVLQEVFASAYTAMLADDRPIMVKPWLYRIARNRSLNHMRKTKPIGVDSMDIHVSEHGRSTADRANSREEFRDLMSDISLLPETQRTALLLREVDGMPYDQIAEAMDTTVPSIKSLLVRARVGLAEMSEARGLTCDTVRMELGEVAEGLTRRLTPPVRRHIKSCDRCKEFKAELTATDAALAAVAPLGMIVAFKNTIVSQLGFGGSSAAAGGSSTAAVGSMVGSSASGSLAGTISAGATTIASKAAAGLAAAAIVTAGATGVTTGVATTATVNPNAIVASATVKPAAAVTAPPANPVPATLSTTVPAEAASIAAPAAAPTVDPATPTTDAGSTMTTTDSVSLPIDIASTDGSTTATAASTDPAGSTTSSSTGGSEDGSAGGVTTGTDTADSSAGGPAVSTPAP